MPGSLPIYAVLDNLKVVSSYYGYLLFSNGSFQLLLFKHIFINAIFLNQFGVCSKLCWKCNSCYEKTDGNPLREALRQIEEEGLVVYEAQKGCVVKTMTYEEMQETYLIQSTLEKLAVQMCGGEISKEQDEEMQKLVLSMEKAANQKNLYDVIKFDEQFHECIVKTAHSEKLHRI